MSDDPRPDDLPSPSEPAQPTPPAPADQTTSGELPAGMSATSRVTSGSMACTAFAGTAIQPFAVPVRSLAARGSQAASLTSVPSSVALSCGGGPAAGRPLPYGLSALVRAFILCLTISM